MRKNVIVIGATGNLGVQLVPTFRDAGHNVVGLTSYDLNFLDDTLTAADVLAAFAKAGMEKPDLIINAAAMNDVDGAESEAGKRRAHRLNAEAPRLLAEVAESLDATFVHVSTDYVFKGDKPEGYVETDEASPVSAYGASKRAGEVAVLEAVARGKNFFVVRTAKLFGPPGESRGAKPSFATSVVKWAMNAHESKPLKLVDEEAGSPTFTVDLAKGILDLVSTDSYAPGVCHLANEGAPVTWAGFAEEIYALLKLNPKREHVSASAFGTRPAARPMHSALLNTRGPKLPSREDALKRFFFGLSLELTGIPGLVVVTPRYFEDERGAFGEPFNKRRWQSFGLPIPDVQLNDSVSHKGIVRGLHFQKPPYAQGKVVRCVRGSVTDVVVDIRQGSPTYGQKYAIELTPQNRKIFVVPPGFAHAYVAHEGDSLFLYGIYGAGWNMQSEGGVRYNDPDLAIDWPEYVRHDLMKPADLAWPTLSELTAADDSPFIYGKNC